MKAKEETINIESLKDVPGLGPVGIERLGYLHIDTKRQLYTDLSPTALVGITGMTQEKSYEAFEYVQDVLVKNGIIPKPYMSAMELYHEQKNLKRYKTGSKLVDEAFSGGILSQYMTEFFGQNGAGKTQLAISILMNVLIEDKEAEIVYIDNENKLQVERFISILKARKIITTDEEADQYLNRIHIFRALNTDEQKQHMTKISNMMAHGANIKLYVIDSVLSLFQAEYQDRGVMKEKFSIVKPMLAALRKLAYVYTIPVISINTVHKGPVESFGANPVIPAGGDTMGHPPLVIAFISKVGSGKKSRVKIEKGYTDKNEADFVITDKGIEDI